MDIETKLKEYQAVEEFMCPAEFWPALGYDGDERYVAIWWEQCGDEASWDDGRSACIGAEWPAYLALLRHNFPPGHPIGWLLGGSDAAATMKLIIDRQTERAWLAPADEAREVLRLQYPVVDAAEDGLGVVPFEQLMALINNLKLSPQVIPNDAAIEEALAKSHQNFEALTAALAARRPVDKVPS